LMAARRTGRRCDGLELDPAYVDTTIRRWQALTGGSARHAASNRSFDDLAREAEATMLPERTRHYEVGYGKPPLHTRFQKGESGNPKGRPRGKKNMATLLSTALNASIVVVANGRRKKITKREAIVTQLVNKSAAADLKATQIVLA